MVIRGHNDKVAGKLSILMEAAVPEISAGDSAAAIFGLIDGGLAMTGSASVSVLELEGFMTVGDAGASLGASTSGVLAHAPNKSAKKHKADIVGPRLNIRSHLVSQNRTDAIMRGGRVLD
ncbi:MAG: hypothetical protein AAGJ68_14005 [Pseudomonadota bacterium]